MKKHNILYFLNYDVNDHIKMQVKFKYDILSHEALQSEGVLRHIMTYIHPNCASLAR